MIVIREADGSLTLEDLGDPTAACLNPVFEEAGTEAFRVQRACVAAAGGDGP